MVSSRVEQRRGSSSERALRDTTSNFRTTNQTADSQPNTQLIAYVNLTVKKQSFLPGLPLYRVPA